MTHDALQACLDREALPLQKLGLVERVAGTVRLRRVAKRLLAEARETAAAFCTQMSAGVSSGW